MELVPDFATSAGQAARAGSWLAPDRREVHPNDAVAARGPLLRGGVEAVVAVRDADFGKARFFERRHELCFQQSASDSTGPEIDVLTRRLRQFDTEHDVRDLHTA